MKKLFLQGLFVKKANLNQLKRIIVAFILLCVLTSCTVEQSNPPNQVTITPAKIYETQFALQTPSPGKSSLYGTVISNTNKAPLSGVLIYAALKVPMSSGKDYILNIQRDSSPHYETNADGYFYLTNIESGKYQLMLYSPFGAMILLSEDGQELHLEISANQNLDLGKLYVNWP